MQFQPVPPAGSTRPAPSKWEGSSPGSQSTLLTFAGVQSQHLQLHAQPELSELATRCAQSPLHLQIRYRISAAFIAYFIPTLPTTANLTKKNGLGKISSASSCLQVHCFLPQDVMFILCLMAGGKQVRYYMVTVKCSVFISKDKFILFTKTKNRDVPD